MSSVFQQSQWLCFLFGECQTCSTCRLDTVAASHGKFPAGSHSQAFSSFFFKAKAVWCDEQQEEYRSGQTIPPSEEFVQNLNDMHHDPISVEKSE